MFNIFLGGYILLKPTVLGFSEEVWVYFWRFVGCMMFIFICRASSANPRRRALPKMSWTKMVTPQCTLPASRQGDGFSAIEGMNRKHVEDPDKPSTHWHQPWEWASYRFKGFFLGVHWELEGVWTINMSPTQPLKPGASQGDLAVVEILLFAGASWDQRNGQGQLPVDLAKREGHKKCLGNRGS